MGGRALRVGVDCGVGSKGGSKLSEGFEEAKVAVVVGELIVLIESDTATHAARDGCVGGGSWCLSWGFGFGFGFWFGLEQGLILVIVGSTVVVVVLIVVVAQLQGSSWEVGSKSRRRRVEGGREPEDE